MSEKTPIEEAMFLCVDVGNIPANETSGYLDSCSVKFRDVFDTSNLFLYPVRGNAAAMQMAFSVNRLASAFERLLKIIEVQELEG